MTVCSLVFGRTSSPAGPMINQGRNQHNDYQVDQGSAKSSFIHYWPFVQRGGTGTAANGSNNESLFHIVQMVSQGKSRNCMGPEWFSDAFVLLVPGAEWHVGTYLPLISHIEGAIIICKHFESIF